ncbi:unnamed protein product [Rodentolepis nana]|uniref:Phosphatidylinositol-4,5-bisphosphate 4-phosphatase n=1 Tax=Rodentolepis nana TaxID=102285 RepID=A0A0R3U0D6_RODNA|nr:unnamed protein product [Rodentolepis nana]
MDESTSLLQEPNAGYSRPPAEQAEIRGNDCQPTVKCQICNTIIPIGDLNKQLVVKCPNCNEATPIKGPPTGKQFVRCQCNCLLICKSSVTRVGCPRENCRRVINLTDTNASGYNAGDSSRDLLARSSLMGSGTFPSRNGIRVTCGNCHRPFSIPQPQNDPPTRFQSLFLNRVVSWLSGGSAPTVNGLIAARCPQCRKITSVGQAYARTRWVAYLIFALLLLVVALAVTIGTASAAHSQHGLYFLWAKFFSLM